VRGVSDAGAIHLCLQASQLCFLLGAQRLALCPFGVLVGGTRERRFDGISLEPYKLLENAVRCTLCWAAYQMPMSQMKRTNFHGFKCAILLDSCSRQPVFATSKPHLFLAFI
jgi:hypothetical protein